MGRKTPKKTALAYPPPATQEDADEMLGGIGECCRLIEVLAAEAEGEIAAIVARHAPRLRLNAEKVKAKFKALSRWAHDKRPQLFAGEKKSLALPQGRLGFRDTPPKVALEEGADEEAIAAELLARGLTDLVRQTVKLDRQAIIKNPERIPADITAIDVEGGEVFFVEPIGIDLEKTKLTKKVELAEKLKLTAKARPPKAAAGAPTGAA
jgi:phage host-nuclease inhibitor protein Gam